MLPSDEKAHFGDIILTPDTKNLLIFQHQNCTEVAQHLYITSDEEIKENSLVLLPDKTIHRMNASDMISYLDSGSKATKLIIASTKAFMSLPYISREFIENYIKAYNTSNVIKEVEVEYEVLVRTDAPFNRHRSLNENTKIKLKVNPDNTINIKQIKYSWNRSEVVELLIKAMIYANQYHEDECYEEDINDWIEENL